MGGFHLSNEDKKLREAKKIHEDFMNLPIDRFMQYFGSPLLQLRSKLPLPVLPEANWPVPEDVTGEIPASSEPSAAAESSPNSESSPVSEPSPESKSSSESKSTVSELQIVSEPAAEENRMYPLQSYRYRPDLYLQIPRERVHGGIIPGKW